MKRTSMLLRGLGILLLLLIALSGGCAALRPPPPRPQPAQIAQVKSVLRGDRELAFRLYPLLSEGRANLVYSPAALRLALTTLWAGARAQTGAELEHLLGLSGEPQPIHEGWAPLATAWTGPADKRKSDAFAFHVANGYFSVVETQFSPEYFELLASHYGTPLVPLDFRGSAETSRVRVNDWVEKHTEARVSEMLPSGSVETNTRLVLVNAAHFDAKWLVPFDPKRTQPGEFHPSDKSKVRADMMGRSGTMSYAESAEAQVVELPYAGGAVVMDVLLPRADLSALESQIANPTKLDDLTSKLAPREVDLVLPRYRSSSRFALREPLGKLGIHAAFEKGKADFSGMTGSRDLTLDDLVHQSVVGVDAQGSEGGPVSGSAQGEPVKLKVDRPFLFVIRDTKLDAVLFVGKVVDPTRS